MRKYIILIIITFFIVNISIGVARKYDKQRFIVTHKNNVPAKKIIVPVKTVLLPMGRGIKEQNIYHCLNKLNEYRTKYGVQRLKIDLQLTGFACEGTIQLMKDHKPHGHFQNAGQKLWDKGFKNMAAENQGDPYGWNPDMKVNDAIDNILEMMIAEGKNGGHYRNMLNPSFTRVGIGLALDRNNKLYFTNNFSQ